MHLTRVYYSTQLFTKHLSSLRRLLQITLNNSFFFDLGSYMLLHLSLERIFLAKERPVFLIKPIWKRLSLIIRCMYVLLSEMHFVEGYNNMFFKEKWFSLFWYHMLIFLWMEVCFAILKPGKCGYIYPPWSEKITNCQMTDWISTEMTIVFILLPRETFSFVRKMIMLQRKVLKNSIVHTFPIQWKVSPAL